MIRIPSKRLAYLLLASIAISLYGCTGVGDQNLYVIEQLHFKAEKLMERKVGIKPELLTDADYDEMINAYLQVVRTFELNFSDLNSKDSLTETERKASHLAGKSLIEVAFLYDRKHDERAVIETLDGFSERFPRNRDQKALALLQLGRKHVNAGDMSRARTAWTRLLDDFYPPADTELHPNTDVLSLPVELARLYYDLEDSQQGEEQLDFAEEYYRRIIDEFRHSPLGMTTVRYLADTYMLRDRPGEAIALLETVTDSTGTIYGTAQLLIAEIYFSSLGDTAEARRRYEAIVESDSDSLSHPQAYLQLARIEFMSGNLAECRKHAATLRDRFGDYKAIQPQVQRLVAQSFDKEGDFSRAFSEYQWLITSFPESKEALETYTYLPEFLRRNEQANLAAEWQDKALRFLSDTKSENQGTSYGLSAHSSLINLLVELEMWDESASELEMLQASYPRSAAGAQALAKAGSIYMERLNMKDRARQSFERQLDLYPNLPISEEARIALRELQNP